MLKHRPENSVRGMQLSSFRGSRRKDRTSSIAGDQTAQQADQLAALVVAANEEQVVFQGYQKLLDLSARMLLFDPFHALHRDINRKNLIDRSGWPFPDGEAGLLKSFKIAAPVSVTAG